MLRLALVCALALAAAACDPAGQDRLLDIDADGTVAGAVFLDLDASETPGAADEPVANLPLALLLAGSTDTIARTTTDAEGRFSFDDVVAGEYEVVVSPGALGDSTLIVYRDPPGLPVGQIGDDDPTFVTVGRDDSLSVTIGIGYPVYSVDEARAVPAGRRIFVRGTALNVINALADSSLYLQGEQGAIRVTRASGDATVPGSQVLALGTTGTRDGQPVVVEGAGRVTGLEVSFDTIAVSAATARNAGGGSLDAQLVRLGEVIVTDTATVGTRFIITVADPSGAVTVVVPAGAVLPAHAPGTELDIVGLLVPAPEAPNTWQVRPRSPDDLRPES